MATITVHGFYITGDDYRRFERDQDVRRMMLSYQWTGDTLIPKAFLVTKPKNEVIKSYVTLYAGANSPIDSPFGISTFFINNGGTNDQFRKLVKDEIDDWNSQHPGEPKVTVDDILKIHFTPAVAYGPAGAPEPFLVLNMTIHFDVKPSSEIGLKAASMAMTTGDKQFQPSPPAQPDDI